MRTPNLQSKTPAKSLTPRGKYHDRHELFFEQAGRRTIAVEPSAGNCGRHTWGNGALGCARSLPPGTNRQQRGEKLGEPDAVEQRVSGIGRAASRAMSNPTRLEQNQTGTNLKPQGSPAHPYMLSGIETWGESNDSATGRQWHRFGRR